MIYQIYFIFHVKRFITYSIFKIIESDILISFEEICLPTVGGFPVIQGRINRKPTCNSVTSSTTEDKKVFFIT